jgi:DNA repair exonuclease SbcCD nuclease subunit
MSRVILVTDTHIGARGDSLVFLDYMDKFYTECFFPYIKANKIDAIIHLGDVFDRRKFVNYNTLQRSKKMFFDPIKELNIPVYVIVGNHDTYHKNTNKINNIELIIQHYSLENIHPVIHHPEMIEIGGASMAMIPWIAPDIEKECIDFIKKCPTDLCFGHFAINGFAMHQGHVEENGMTKDLFEKFDMVFSGHFHHRSSNGKIYYLGNPYEITWSDYGDTKGFHVFDTQTRELTFIENDFHMFHKITYNENLPFFKTKAYLKQPKFFENLSGTYVKIIVEEKTNNKDYDIFLDNLYNANPYNIDFIETFSDLLEIELDDIQTEDTISLIELCVDNYTIDTDINKKTLKKMLVSAYHESLNQ